MEAIFFRVSNWTSNATLTANPDPDLADEYGIQKSQILYCIKLVLDLAEKSTNTLPAGPWAPIKSSLI